MPKSAWLVLLLTACADQKPDGADTEDVGGDEDGGVELVLTLGATEASAGDEVPYTLEAVHADGSREPVSGTVESDLEAGLVVDDDGVVATVAGTHTLTGAAVVDGEDLSATATLEVAAGDLATLDLVLAAATADAGEAVAYTVTGADAWDNAVDVSGAELIVDDEFVVDGCCTSGTITGSVVGEWAIIAAVGGDFDTELLTITGGAPAAIELTLDPTDVEPGDTATATVSVTDTYGNPTDAAWTLSVSGGDATVSGDQVTFDGEGWFTVTAQLDNMPLSDSVGPLLVDATGPTLVVEVPERGAWSSTGAAPVSGTVEDEVAGVAGVTVNGAAATVPGDGTFAGGVTLDFGLNVLETTAVDADGNTTADVRAALAGDVLAWGQPETDGLVVRLHEGEGGLDTLTAGLADTLDGAALLAALPSPLYEGEESRCITIFGRTTCTTYSLTLTVTGISWASADLTLDPQADGTVHATLTITDPAADWSATGEAASMAYASTGTATAGSLVIEADVSLSVSGGAVIAEVSGVDATLGALDLGLPSWATTVLSYLGTDLEAEVEAALETAAESEFASGLESALGDGLDALSFSSDTTLGDATATLSGTPAAIAVDDTGITLSLATTVELDAWVLDQTAAGSLEYGYGAPSWTGTPGALVGFSADFFGQVLYAAWGGGALSMEATDEELGVDMASLSLLLPGLTDLTVVVEPLLPPVVVPGTTSTFDLQIGDMRVSLYDGAAAEGAEVYQFYVSTVTPMDVAVSGDALTTSLGTPAASVDVVLAPEGVDHAGLEAVLEVLAPSLLTLSSFAEITLPDLGGYALTGATVSTGGAEAGYAVVGGELSGS